MCCNYYRNSCRGCGYGSSCGYGSGCSSGCGYGCGYGSGCCSFRPFCYRRYYSSCFLETHCHKCLSYVVMAALMS
nr:keratin-associated protein 21-2-like [Cavia porcellus]